MARLQDVETRIVTAHEKRNAAASYLVLYSTPTLPALIRYKLHGPRPSNEIEIDKDRFFALFMRG